VSDREALIRSFFPIVRSIARRIARMVPGSDLDDLIGDGCVGLIRAVDAFDPARGPTMNSYVSRVIAGTMLNGLRRLDPVSERVRREVREAERERYTRAVEDGVLPTQHEMEIRRPALRRAALHAYRYTPLSLDSPLPVDESLSGDWTQDPALLAGERLHSEYIRGALMSLSRRQRSVVALYYFCDKSLYEIGRTLAISPQRASQLHVAALRNLRKVLHAPSVG
jgi:RNA polymerase sigma factor for flagellar operon FliA